MRSYLPAAAFAALFAIPATAPAYVGALDSGVTHIRHEGQRHWGYGPDCRELRRACLYKEDLGERGEGNCRRYRALCR